MRTPGIQVQLHHLFVYGTLKRGQCREKCWPVVPQQVSPAFTAGSLFDLGPYPAMTRGTAFIAGELWSFTAEQIDEVRECLDRIEVTNQPGIPNEYDRITVEVQLLDSQSVLAECYLFARPEELNKLGRHVEPSRAFQQISLAIWPSNCQWP